RRIIHVVLGLDDRFAGVQGFDLGQRVPTGPNSFGQAEQDAAALLGGGAFPSSVKRFLCRLSCPVHILGIAGGAGGDHIFGGGIADVGGVSASCVHQPPLAIEFVAVVG